MPHKKTCHRNVSNNESCPTKSVIVVSQAMIKKREHENITRLLGVLGYMKYKKIHFE